MTTSADEPKPTAVDARYGQGVQVGDHNTLYLQVQGAVPESGAVVTAIHAEPDAEVFVGRAPDFERLTGLLAPTEPGVARPVAGVVQGMGGIGKTALVRRVAVEAVASGWFPGGAVFVDLRGYEPTVENRIRPGQVFASALRALGVPAEGIPTDVAQQPTAYHRHLDLLAARGQRVLVVLDNAADPDQVRDLLPTPFAARAHRVLITSRDTLPLAGADRVELGVLAPDEAAELLRAVLHQRARSRGLPADPRVADAAAVAEVLRWCGWLPQAVAIAAGVLAEEPDFTMGELAADLADMRTRLDVLDDGVGGIHAAFATSWQRLRTRDPEAARLLCLLTIAPGPDSGLAAAAAVMGVDEVVARVRLRVLTRAHLLLGGPRRWQFHDLLRLAVARHAVADLGISSAQLAAATDRVLDHYLVTTRAALDWMATVRSQAPHPHGGPFTGWQDALTWLDTEQACLVAAVATAEEAEQHQKVVDLAFALSNLWSWRRQVADWGAVARIADRSARRLRDPVMTVLAIDNLAAALTEAGRFEEALQNLNTALLAGRVLLDDLAIDGRMMDDMGLALQGVGDAGRAASYHLYAADLFQELGDRRSEAAARSNAGSALQKRGDHIRALDEHTAAVAIFHEIGDRPHAAMARGNLAITLYELQQRGDAIDVFLAVGTAFEEVGDRRSAAQTWRNLGVVFREAGWLADTVQAFVAAAVTYAKIGDRRAEVQVWRELERIFTEAGRPDDARDAAERAAPAPETAGCDEPVQGLLGWRLRPDFEDEPTR
ncbi:tetratricopeptide repeat protein [Amycolatopsis japonica]